ncbi:hypothetical protein MLAC_47700 [Mycobacterium lacus]|uniref:Uncharacterized protein n=1 Tax=Mycobacterium lacus TaxID=169765 RepID=A0A7I7NHA1_9MYCO|nr:hypothetical protein MLAC_12180 [Mycobacterium lacus]BBX97693.1 hypothetical protein MLAC_29870 [Mycobacterium lacus]BBX98189.1 hypothetical protein MLAC_34830 [Mycobacterium lacus]BBX98918.1 hypothetical protein MLAC_42120 [Mycobacterium lacus]BBX99476.1 hypothetical protein MLAC_47700 [Mycobacterium lacus]
MFDLIELYTHWQAGRSQVQLWQSLGMDRKTIRKYLAPAVAEGIGPGGEPLSAEQWAARIAQWFPGLDDRGARASTWPLIDRHSDRIRTGCTPMLRSPRSRSGYVTTIRSTCRSPLCGVGWQ